MTQIRLGEKARGQRLAAGNTKVSAAGALAKGAFMLAIEEERLPRNQDGARPRPRMPVIKTGAEDELQLLRNGVHAIRAVAEDRWLSEGEDAADARRWRDACHVECTDVPPTAGGSEREDAPCLDVACAEGSRELTSGPETAYSLHEEPAMPRAFCRGGRVPFVILGGIMPPLPQTPTLSLHLHSSFGLCRGNQIASSFCWPL